MKRISASGRAELALPAAISAVTAARPPSASAYLQSDQLLIQV
jgi:hypothetical protein